MFWSLKIVKGEILQSVPKRTVKASNFGPLFQKGLLSSKRVLQKNEENKVVEKL